MYPDVSEIGRQVRQAFCLLMASSSENREMYARHTLTISKVLYAAGGMN